MCRHPTCGNCDLREADPVLSRRETEDPGTACAIDRHIRSTPEDDFCAGAKKPVAATVCEKQIIAVIAAKDVITGATIKAGNSGAALYFISAANTYDQDMAIVSAKPVSIGAVNEVSLPRPTKMCPVMVILG